MCIIVIFLQVVLPLVFLLICHLYQYLVTSYILTFILYLQKQAIIILDLDLLEHLQSFLTDRRKETFESVLSKRTRHFTVVTEDVYQLHNTSAVMRSCDVFGIQDLSIVERAKR